jgi:iron complex outermembrane receptor protein
MIDDRRNRYTLLGIGVLLALAEPAAVYAQQPLEEIVVTARRRAETFEDVPVTISVFDAGTIEAAGIERPRDFIALTPNVTLTETQNQGNAFVTVRGISQARNSEPSVAVLVDGVLMSNPAQFNQELFDVQQIEVLKGAQGAVYGRNAIGGAIVITTKEPGDEFEGKVRVGSDSGPGVKAQVMGGGPLGDSGKLKYHAALSYMDTDGYIDNPYLHEKADPYKDVSARARLLWTPNDKLKLDARLYASKLDTQALYFNIVSDVNDTHLPVRVNNSGENGRDLTQASLKIDYDLGPATLTSITSFDTVKEILTGDAFDFLPIPESFFFNLFNTLFGAGNGFDLNQSQFLDVDTWSQEVRFTSNETDKLRWIGGAYMIGTDRFISTGNMVDTGNGVFPVYRNPSTNPLNPQFSFLADSQDNFAWALFGELDYDLTDRTELSVALRYDEDTRKNTTDTPTLFLPNSTIPGVPQGATGEVRKHTWSEMQPRVTLRWKATDHTTLFGGYSKGFRSGGFNQTGVETVAITNGIAGVHDIFDAEVAETWEFGVKSLLANNRVSMNFSVFDTEARGSYFFVFLAANSTQNLGNLGKVDYTGFEFDMNAKLSDHWDVTFGYGDTDSKIKESATPSDIGNQAPLVTRDTTNVGVQYRQPFGDRGLDFFARADYRRMGKTYWDPANSTVRDPVNLLDWRIGVEGKSWSVIGWQRNANDVRYNAEFSPGGFVFKAKPRIWGVDFVKNF